MKTLTLLFILAVATPALADRPLPESQWTPKAHLWLSRAVVAEAGWLAKRDHALIAWALSYRWKEARERYPKLRFVDTIRGYCAGLGARKAATRRQIWVRSLPAWGRSAKPQGWPGHVSWKKHLGYWKQVQTRMRRWGAGGVRDASHGRVRHWGSPSPELPDIGRARRMIEAGQWEKLDVGETQNEFYGIARGKSSGAVSTVWR